MQSICVPSSQHIPHSLAMITSSLWLSLYSLLICLLLLLLLLVLLCRILNAFVLFILFLLFLLLVLCGLRREHVSFLLLLFCSNTSVIFYALISYSYASVSSFRTFSALTFTSFYTCFLCPPLSAPPPQSPSLWPSPPYRRPWLARQW